MRLFAQKRKILIIIICFLLIFSVNLFQKEFRNFFHSFSAPIQKALWDSASNLSGFFEGAFQKDQLKKENTELKLENLKLLAENVALRELREENFILREALELGLAEEFDLGFARITGKEISQDSVFIDKGSAHGISEGLAVITEQRVLLGRIEEAYENFSIVSLISNKKSSFDAEILTHPFLQEEAEDLEKSVEVLARGKGGQELYLDFIPREENIKEGDLVVSSSLGGVYPFGLLVGTVVSVEKDDVQPFQQAEVSPFFNLREIRNVFIILK